jgi:HD-GYP domain-containing protein (c-di-GMP phosphodiesterase class II)
LKAQGVYSDLEPPVKSKVFVRDLKPGMFVYELDRPWLDTPYMFQGFLIQSEDDIEELARYCEYVFIDELRAQPEKRLKGRQKQAKGRMEPGHQVDHSTIDQTAFLGKTAYPDTHSTEKELPLATEARQATAQILESVRMAVEKGLNLDVEQVQHAVDGLRESIIRNPDALMFLTQLRNTQSSVYDRAINVAVYLLAFGRYLGLARDELSELGLGGLLLDIGKLKLPSELLEKKTTYTPVEHSLFKRHVAFSESMVQNIPGVTAKVRDMISQHHERENGSGYPKGLHGRKLTTFGKMAAVVDCFEELVIEHPFARSLPPHEALQLIQSWGGRFFHQALVEHFIQCTGVYPVGSLVELTTGAVGIVVSQNRKNRLQPRVLLVLDSRKSRYPSPKVIDLLTDRENEYGLEYEIGRSLEFGMYGIDPNDYYA